MLRTIALASSLLLALLLAIAASRVPPPVAADAPLIVFAAERAMVDVRQIARAPHPMGSLENARVRDYLLGRLRSLGLEVELQRTPATLPRAWDGRAEGAAIVVENLLGVLPGKDRSLPALAIMAHYDSVPGSPGAADDAAGVAAALESVRALQAMGQPARDVLVLLTDGEEPGALGAETFFAHHPLASRIGAVINLEARGGGGRAYMFETGPQNGAMIDLFRRSVEDPTSNSLAVFLYSQMPNSSDFSEASDRGIAGFNFAFIDRPLDYHSSLSTAESLERGALQHLGAQTLAISRALAFAETLPPKRPEVVYADIFGLFVIAYPPAAGWGLIVLVASLLGLMIQQALRKGAKISLRAVLQACAGALYLLELLAFVFELSRRATGIPLGYKQDGGLLAQFRLYEAALLALGLGTILLIFAVQQRKGGRLSAAGLGLSLGAGFAILMGSPLAWGIAASAALLGLLGFGPKISPSCAWTGVMLMGFVVAVLLQALAPGLAFLFAWPLLLAVLAGLAATLVDREFARPLSLVILGLAGTLGAGWLLYLAHAVALGVGADMPWALAILGWLVMLMLCPLIAIQHRPAQGGALAMVVGVLMIAIIGLRRDELPIGASSSARPGTGTPCRELTNPCSPT